MDNTQISDIVQKFGSKIASLLVLIEAGLKPGGEFSLGHQREQYEQVQAYLTNLGFESYINYREMDHEFESQVALERAKEDIESNGLDYEIIENGQEIPTLRLYNIPVQLLFWRNETEVDPETAAKAYNEGDHETFGKFAGYPECCINAFQRKESIIKYHDELRERVSTEGVEGIEHLVGIQHIPDSIDCEETKQLGYAQYLKENVPFLYATELRSLLGRLEGELS